MEIQLRENGRCISMGTYLLEIEKYKKLETIFLLVRTDRYQAISLPKLTNIYRLTL